MMQRLERVEEKLDAVIELLMDLRQVFFEVAKEAGTQDGKMGDRIDQQRDARKAPS